MEIREAMHDDAAGMRSVLEEIIAATGREHPIDAAFVASHYIANPTGIRCSVAVDDMGAVLGFQSLIAAAAGNIYGVLVGGGIVGTHIHPRAHRQGVGRALFVATRAAAAQAGLESIDAYIGADNPSGLTYYEAMGFRTYRQPRGVVQKVFDMRRVASDTRD